MSISDNLKSTINLIKEKLDKSKEIAIKLNCADKTIKEIDLQINFIATLQEDLTSHEGQFTIHYMSNIDSLIEAYKDNLPVWYGAEGDVSDEGIRQQSRTTLEYHFGNNSQIGNATHLIDSLVFLTDFFRNLNYLSSNMVIIGANGSGKSSLAATLKNYLGPASLVISAQKLLIIPEFNSISNPTSANTVLINQQNTFNYTKWTYRAGSHPSSISYIQDLTQQFHILLDNLLAERSAALHKYIEEVRASTTDDHKSNIPNTNLDRVIVIWNELFQHRTLVCNHLNISVKVKGTDNEYEANHMSDGEKVALYYIAQILQAQNDSLIIIDEPEMYLHKTILSKLWDTLEKERNDCVFLYLTHDIDFAIARNDARKYWMRGFNYPNNWDINEIENTEELPENLLLELVGSRKNILFCEGEIGKSDDEIYKILFPNFTIKPVGSCINVINFTRAFNKIHNRATQAFGLIDSDHSPTNRLERLKEDMIFSLEVAEIENLLLDEDLLKIVVHNSPVDYNQEIIDRIKNTIISALEEDIENQAASFISTEIDFYFKEANIREGKTKSAIESNFQSFVASIQINDKYNERVNKLKEIVNQKQYLEVLKVYNNKGLMAKTHNILEIKSYKRLAIKQLKLNQEARDCLKKHFPDALLHVGIYTP